MVEKGFVDALIATVKKFDGAVAIRPSDNFTLGIPDVLAWVPAESSPRPQAVWAIAMEAKQLRPLMKDPFERGRRVGQMLKHPFTGPQISLLRKMKRAGVEAFGIVRVSEDTAFRIEPEVIPAKTGNFTYEEMVEFGTVVQRGHGVWRFW